MSPEDVSLIDIFGTIADYDEKMREEIKLAYDANDQGRVFQLVGAWLYEGPYSVKDSSLNYDS